MLKKINIQINGIHCKSCKTLIETEVDVLAGVNTVDVDHISGKTYLEFDDEKTDIEKIFKEIKKLNYKPLMQEEIKDETKNNKEEKKIDNKKNPNSETKSIILGALIPLGVSVLIGGYLIIQNLGGFELMAKLNEDNVGYGIIFIIGILTGFHCIGMCGGLVVAYSAKKCKDESKCDKKEKTCIPSKKSLMPHLQYNTGRLISYASIGGILGGIGSFFAVSPTFTGGLIIFAGVFMFLMGLSFITNWDILEKIKLRSPQFIARFLYNQKYSKKSNGPFVVGLLNGFMPCGPLQAMQLYALASGSAIKGAASMAIYAAGTIPLMFGFGAFLSMISQNYIKKITKASGILIIVLGLFMANRGLANFGYNIGNLTFEKNINNASSTINSNKKYQEVRMELNYYGYSPNVLYIKRGVPVRWIINVTQMSGCTDAIMIESLGIKQDLYKGENVIEFMPPDNVSQLDFSCWMRMVWGKFILTDNDYKPTTKDIERDSKTVVAGSGCGGGTGGCGCGSRR